MTEFELESTRWGRESSAELCRLPNVCAQALLRPNLTQTKVGGKTESDHDEPAEARAGILRERRLKLKKKRNTAGGKRR